MLKIFGKKEEPKPKPKLTLKRILEIKLIPIENAESMIEKGKVLYKGGSCIDLGCWTRTEEVYVVLYNTEVYSIKIDHWYPNSNAPWLHGEIHYATIAKLSTEVFEKALLLLKEKYDIRKVC